MHKGFGSQGFGATYLLAAAEAARVGGAVDLMVDIDDAANVAGHHGRRASLLLVWDDQVLVHDPDDVLLVLYMRSKRFGLDRTEKLACSEQPSALAACEGTQ
ncbi:hypothetical protein F5X96DRAFT_666407 [Biscogniauxia mediterranea]|nr:hypothetical protein F5X96DRAFT_666407 [Biscogniauxia mediterranea]